MTRQARCVSSGVCGCLLWFVAAGGVLAEADALARLEGALAQALEANERLAALAERQREENVRLREELSSPAFFGPGFYRLYAASWLSSQAS